MLEKHTGKWEVDHSAASVEEYPRDVENMHTCIFVGMKQISVQLFGSCEVQ